MLNKYKYNKYLFIGWSLCSTSSHHSVLFCRRLQFDHAHRRL